MAVLVLTNGAWASAKEKVIYSFDVTSGAAPEAPLIRDAVGNLYGTTIGGGAFGYGDAFELARLPGGAWKEIVLYSFTGGEDGGEPWDGLTFDSAGNLYGTTFEGGAYEQGTVFEMSPAPGGWNETVIYSFTGNDDGANPFGGVILDATGNLYGTTAAAGKGGCGGFSIVPISGCGAVFELSPTSGGGWNETTLHTFSGKADGGQPVAGLIMDGNGNLYGTTFDGGNAGCNDGCGVVFELSPKAGGGWQGTTLASFLGSNGAYPSAPLVLDAEGNLYGTTSARGESNSNCPNGCGTVFKLSPNPGGGWQGTTLHLFTGGDDGGEPVAGLVFDGSGNLYGTTTVGGCVSGCGMVFELKPVSSGWREVVIHTFLTGSDGSDPRAAVVIDPLGNIFGTSQGGGNDYHGAVFEVVP
jgi:uncharacterized repeat protein (TIGR03803 family)